MNSDFSSALVAGLGYIGLPTAAIIASRGIDVTGYDINDNVVEQVAAGNAHIYETDLDGLVQKVVSSGKLQAANKPSAADVFIIAVPTPIGEDHVPVTDYIFDTARSIAPVLSEGVTIILESTSPVGTTEQLSDLLAELRPDLKFPSKFPADPDVAVAYCPERVLPGRILTEVVENDRCIGGITPRCARKAQSFYKTFVRGKCITTNARAAELVKLTENSFRDTNIAFANELSIICDKFEINAWEVIELANRHPRVNILNPGPGVGGHCIAVDPWFIIHSAPEHTRLIRTAREVNDEKAEFTIEHCNRLIEDNPGEKIALFGLTFKADIDDLRESPALEIASNIVHQYRDRVRIVEPYVVDLPEQLRNHGAKLTGLDDALKECGILIVLVDHDVFKLVEPQERIGRAIFDTRGIWRDYGNYAA
ncbi:MAG: UDP-N-acetyl-D-mannosamine dehydrogenase [Rhizobiaceae bacterium]